MFQDREFAQQTSTAGRMVREWVKPVGAAACVAAVMALTSVGGVRMAAQTDGAPEDSFVLPQECDFVTSGGFVNVGGDVSNPKANFGAHGGCKNGRFWGHVNYVDHTKGLHMNSTEITGYFHPAGQAPTVRDICGWGMTNQSAEPVRFRVRVNDVGEPGPQDQFGIIIDVPADPGPYLVTLRELGAQPRGRGGNVQLHGTNPSTVTWPETFDESVGCNGLNFVDSDSND